MRSIGLYFAVVLSTCLSAFSHEVSATQNDGTQFCDFLFLRTSAQAFSKQTDSGYAIYESRESKKLIAQIKTGNKVNGQTEILSIEDGTGKQLAPVPVKTRVGGVMFNNGSFPEPVKCSQVSRLVIKETGSVRFIASMDPNSEY